MTTYISKFVEILDGLTVVRIELTTNFALSFCYQAFQSNLKISWSQWRHETQLTDENLWAEETKKYRLFQVWGTPHKVWWITKTVCCTPVTSTTYMCCERGLFTKFGKHTKKCSFLSEDDRKFLFREQCCPECKVSFDIEIAKVMQDGECIVKAK